MFRALAHRQDLPVGFTMTKGQRRHWNVFTVTELVYVIARGRVELRINFRAYFQSFPKLPESRSDEGNLGKL